MLFSDPQTARFINEHFEPVWESVRDVPRFTLDFGNGNVVHRTIYGNTATLICTADGIVLDTMPGIYSPRRYVHSLGQIYLLARYATSDDGKVDQSLLMSYHKRIAADLRERHYPSELRLRQGHVLLVPSNQPLPVVPNPSEMIVENVNLQSKKGVEAWQALAAEYKYNEFVRRKTVHEYLSFNARKHGTSYTKWMFSKVLHADLDDPYLGLAPVLFATYPFNDSL